MVVFYLNDTATTEIYTLSLPDALPIYRLAFPGPAAGRAGRVPDPQRRPRRHTRRRVRADDGVHGASRDERRARRPPRSEEHTSELQSRQYLVCRLLLENNILIEIHNIT